MAAAASDRLSDLSDDVLIHVLSFLSSKGAARTTILSRRWRCPLWLETAVFNLDSRGCASPVSDAEHALAFQHSQGRVPSKVTLVMHNCSMHDDVPRAACRDKAAVQDLRLDCRTMFCKGRPDSLPQRYSLPPNLLPFAALQFLDLKGCHLKDVMQPLPFCVIWFPCLAVLRLRLCTMELGTLRDLVSSAPVLAELCLESLNFTDVHCFMDPRLHLRCPVATAIAMTNMVARESDRCTVELDAPRLRCFHYAQHVWFSDLDEFSFKSP